MILKEIDLFKGIELTVLEEIAEISSEEVFQKGDRIFRQGESAQKLYFIMEGSLDLVLERNAYTMSFQLSNPGDVFGWSGMSESGRYTIGAVSRTDLKTMVFEKEKFGQVLKAHPEVCYKVLQRLMDVFSDRLEDAYRLFQDSFD